MAGSFGHCLTDDGKSYRGTDLLDHMGDGGEAIDEMMFIIGRLCGGDFSSVREISEEYYRCLHREEPWPDYMRPGIDCE